MEKGLVSQLNILETQLRHKSDIIFKISKNINVQIPGTDSLTANLAEVRNRFALNKLDADNLSEESITRFNEPYHQLLVMQDELLIIAQADSLQAKNQEFRELNTELEGTSLRISNERRRLNQQIDNYNKYINGFFNIAIAQVFGFREWPNLPPVLGE